MPVLKIQTNKQLEPENRQDFLNHASSTVASMLGKPERYVMVLLELNNDMLFDASKAPLAYLELKSLGLPTDRTSEFSATLCALMEKDLQIPSDRVYIEFSNAERHLWGWSKSTF